MRRCLLIVLGIVAFYFAVAEASASALVTTTSTDFSLRAPKPIFSKCSNLGGICLTLTETGNCTYNVTIGMGGAEFSQVYKGELPSSTCVDLSVEQCQICARINDITPTSGCFVGVMSCHGMELISEEIGCYRDLDISSCIECPNDCSGHGECDNGVCVCDSQWGGQDCGTFSPGTNFERCFDSPIPFVPQACLGLNFTLCQITLSMSTQNSDGSNKEVYFQQSVEIAQLETNPEQLICKRIMGCEVCVRMKDFKLNNVTSLASGCPEITGSCFGANFPPIETGCFNDSAIFGNCLRCPNDCTPPHGTCNAQGVCQCTDGWKGLDCSYKDCLNNCSGKGICELGRCKCNPGWGGETCALVCEVGTDNVTDVELTSEGVSSQSLTVGGSYSAYLTTNLNLAQLNFVISPNSGAIMSAYLRRDCRANSQIHDAENPSIVYNPTIHPYYGMGTVVSAVQDCYLGSRGDRWYINVTCTSCTSCADNKCVFDLTPYAEYITEIVPGQTASHAMQIYTNQRHYYSLHVGESAKSQYLSLSVLQVATEKGTYLNKISALPHRCPDSPPYDITIQQPFANTTASDNQVVYKFFGSKQAPTKGAWFIRVDGCQDTATHTCAPLNYSIGAAVSPYLCDSPCMNGGTCSAPSTCSCPRRWSGPTCESPICRFNCSGHGQCVAPGVCECTKGWDGPGCATPSTTGDGGDGSGDGGADGGGDGKTGDGKSDGGDSGPSAGKIAAIILSVFVGVMVIAIAAGGAYYYRFKRRQRAQQEYDYHVLNAQPLEDVSLNAI